MWEPLPFGMADGKIGGEEMGAVRNPASLTEVRNKWEMERGGDRG